MGRSASTARACIAAALAAAGACNPYRDELPAPLCREAADCPAGLGCAAGGHCEAIGRLSLNATFTGRAPYPGGSAARLLLLPPDGAVPRRGTPATFVELANVPLEAGSTRTVEIDALPSGTFLAVLAVDAPPASAPGLVDLCAEDAFGYAHVRIGAAIGRALGPPPGERAPAVHVRRVGDDALCLRR